MFYFELLNKVLFILDFRTILVLPSGVYVTDTEINPKFEVLYTHAIFKLISNTTAVTRRNA